METQQTINDWANQTFGPVKPTGWARVFQRFLSEVVELRDALRATNGAGDELADCAILLYRLAAILRIDLQAAIDRKMSVNRAREWTVHPQGGVGQHVR